MPLLTQDEIAKEIAEGFHKKHNHNEVIRVASTDAALFAANSITFSLAHKVKLQEIVSNTQILIHTKVREIGAISELFPEQVELAQSIVVKMIYGIVEDVIKGNGALDGIEERAEVMEFLAQGGQALLEEADAQPVGMGGEDDSSGDESGSDVELVDRFDISGNRVLDHSRKVVDEELESDDGSSLNEEVESLCQRSELNLTSLEFKEGAKPLRKGVRKEKSDEDSRTPTSPHPALAEDDSTPVTPTSPHPELVDFVPDLGVAHHEMHVIVEAEVKLVGEGVGALVGKVAADPWGDLMDHF